MPLPDEAIPAGGDGALGDDGDDESMSQANSLMDHSLDGLEHPPRVQGGKKCAAEGEQLVGLTRDTQPAPEAL